jgi:hypothetical protein
MISKQDIITLIKFIIKIRFNNNFYFNYLKKRKNMHTSFIKARVFAILALIILTLSFTFPMIVFHGVLNGVHGNETKQITPLVKTVWNLYNQGRYKSIATNKEAHNNLEKMIQTQAELGVASLPIWAVSLEAPNYPKEGFRQGKPEDFHFDGFSG